MPGCEALAATRSQGKSIDLGVGMLMEPTAPASASAFSSGEVRAKDFRGPGRSAGPPLM